MGWTANAGSAVNGGANAPGQRVAAAGPDLEGILTPVPAHGTLHMVDPTSLPPSHRTLAWRPRLGMVAAAALAALIGCGHIDDQPSGQANPAATLPPTPPAPADAAVTAERAVLEAYRAMWDTYTLAGRPPTADPDDPRLARYATGDALRVLIQGLSSMREQGLVTDGTMTHSPQVTNLNLASHPMTARVTDCADTTTAQRVRADGEPFADEPGGKRLIVADLEDAGQGMGWKVTAFGVREPGSC